MNYATIEYKGETMLCFVNKNGDKVFQLSHYFKEKTPASMAELIASYREEWTDDIFHFFEENPRLAISSAEVTFLAPIPSPARNIVCLGKNYGEHATELKGQIFSDAQPEFPIYFTKPDHTVTGTGKTILLHENLTKMLDYEVELALIIGKKGIDIRQENAEEYIFGYTVANDISARDLQQNHSQWYKGKSLTSHCPMGPFIVHKSALPLPLRLEIKSFVNGELRQNGNTKDLLFDIPAIISDLSKGYELRPGDIILTGTPAGVGMGFNPPKYLKAKDEVICQIERIGSLINTVDL